MDQIEPIAARVPYFVNIGNHEVEDGECAVPYNVRFTMPTNGLPTANETRNLWYSFNWGPIHFLQMSTEHDFTEGSPQWNFLANDLAKVNRSLTPWVIFTGHRMMYSNDAGDFGEGMRDELEKLLYVSPLQLSFFLLFLLLFLFLFLDISALLAFIRTTKLTWPGGVMRTSMKELAPFTRKSVSRNLMMMMKSRTLVPPSTL